MFLYPPTYHLNNDSFVLLLDNTCGQYMLQNVHPNHCGHLHMYMNGIKLNIYLNHSKYSSKSGCDMFPSTCTDAFCLYYSVALHVTKHLPLKFKLLNVG